MFAFFTASALVVAVVLQITTAPETTENAIKFSETDLVRVLHCLFLLNSLAILGWIFVSFLCRRVAKWKEYDLQEEKRINEQLHQMNINVNNSNTELEQRIAQLTQELAKKETPPFKTTVESPFHLPLGPYTIEYITSSRECPDRKTYNVIGIVSKQRFEVPYYGDIPSGPANEFAVRDADTPSWSKMISDGNVKVVALPDEPPPENASPNTNDTEKPGNS